ncbi:MAG TPA: NADH:flavin oxidoreductase, partial [Microthrixaceae bacterium]|nr:NADH:flavin oxidoreductase [Microthrixaceae bacterium]
NGWVDMVGLGRMVLSYPDLPDDVLGGRSLAARKVCRTFSDCTTAPRNGLVSGCYPLDPFYKERPERVELAAIKRRLRTT